MDQSVIDAVAAAGFEVWMRDPKDTFMLFTDGRNIGYLEDNRLYGYSISTVHIPNKSTGTGFQIERHVSELTKDRLERAFISHPSWARGDEISSVKKYRDMEHYRSGNRFNAEYRLIAGHITQKETRHFKASVRREGSIGAFETRIFTLVVTITGSHHSLSDEAIRLIRAEGYETERIIEHSTRRDCL